MSHVSHVCQVVSKFLAPTGREQLVRYRRTGELWFRYEHVKNWSGLEAALVREGWDLRDGAEWVEIVTRSDDAERAE